MGVDLFRTRLMVTRCIYMCPGISPKTVRGYYKLGERELEIILRRAEEVGDIKKYLENGEEVLRGGSFLRQLWYNYFIS